MPRARTLDVFPTLRSLVTPNEFEQIGETLEKSETEKFGADGFEKVVKKIEALEKRLGIDDISRVHPEVVARSATTGGV